MVGDGLAQLLDHDQAMRARVVVPVPVDLEARVLALGGVHRAGADAYADAPHVDAGLEHVGEALGERRRIRQATVVHQHAELVPAEPGDDVIGPDQAREALGDGVQRLVAGRMPESVVHLLEAVQVDHERGDRADREHAGRVGEGEQGIQVACQERRERDEHERPRGALGLDAAHAGDDERRGQERHDHPADGVRARGRARGCEHGLGRGRDG
jgi:hypothetical protein